MNTTLSHVTKGITAAFLLTALAACGGGGPGSPSSSTPSGTPSGTGTGSTDKIEIGNSGSGAFTNAVLSVSPVSITASGSSIITANLFDATTGAAYTQAATVAFSSGCSNPVSSPTPQATFTPASVNTSTGTATSTYQSTGCSGNDLITAKATINGSTLIATGTISVAAATVGGMQFISAVPAIIDLQGTGGQTVSAVTFQVNDINGNPVPNSQVDFSLNTTAGGITINPASGTTNSKGQVSTNLTSGTVHIAVNITATLHGTSTSITALNAVTISTGVPVQTAFSLAIKTHNVEGGSIDGITDAVTVHLADRYGNPVADGTQVQFTTNGGSIGASCATANGTCSVNWVSQDPRPVTDSVNKQSHAHILAYTVGEEHFTDNNGNNIFDNGDTFSKCCSGIGDNFSGQPGQDDIGDPYMNSAETGAYVVGEKYFDISSGAARRSPNGAWFGAGCGGFGTTTANVSVVNPSGTIQCANSLTMIGQDACIVMATSGAQFTGPTGGPISSGSGQVTYTVSDLNGQVMPAGTTVTLVSSNLSEVTVTLAPSVGGTSFTMPDVGCAGSGPIGFTVTVTPTAASTGPWHGSFFLQVASPSGLISQSSAVNF